ncbi:Apicidin F synthase [Colletotrichum sp. SAR11_240]|nr:Apicidin F synthase [Colletotrichum sp. SAR11_240]
MCNLPAFAGAQPESKEAAYVDIDIEDLKQSGIPAGSFLNAAWCLALYLYTGQDHISFASTGEDGKPESKTYIVNQQHTFRDVVNQLAVTPTHNGVDGTHTNGVITNGSQETSYNTVIRFASQSSRANGFAKANGVKTSPFTLPDDYQLALEASSDGVMGPECRLLFRLSFISPNEAQNVASTLSHLIHELVYSGNKLIRNLQLSQKDQDQIAQWNSVPLSYSERLLHEAITQVARERPDAAAIDAWDGRMSFKTLEDTSNLLGKQLIRYGVVPGSLVLLSFEKSLWAVVSWLAVLKAGAACVFLDQRAPPNRVQQIIRATGATHALTSASTATTLSELGLAVIQVPSHAATSNGFHDDGHVWPRVHPEDTAFVIFTSGSTGTPKGIVLSHSIIYTTALDIIKNLEVKGDSRILQFCSYTFDMSIADMATGLLAGASHRRFYKTGDLARYSTDGSLECLGRADTQIKLGGQRVELSDIEHHLRRHTSITESAVFFPRHGPLAGRLTAVVVEESSPAITNGHGSYFRPCEVDFVSKAKSLLLQAVAPYMVPSLWLQTPSLPYTSTGKLDRPSLLDKLEAVAQESSYHLLGEKTTTTTFDITPAEEMLQQACSDVLNIPLHKVVEKAIASLVARHPMLRARFEQAPTGEWVQYITENTDQSYQFVYHPTTTSDLRAKLMLTSRASLSAEKGPLIRVNMFEDSGAQYLFLREYANTLTISRVLPELVPASDFSFWGIERQQNIYADVLEKRFSISPDITNDVLVNCHRALQTEPVDILIAALLQSFGKAFRERRPPAVFTEAHGREAWDDQMDLSRTIGWFTTVYPIHASDFRDTIDLVMKVKDTRKRTPNNGFDYFSASFLTTEGHDAFQNHLPAEVLFNYEGRYQLLEKEGSLLRQESWTAGEALEDISPELQRFSLFEIAASVLDDRLQFTFAWNSRLKHQSKIEMWLASIPAAVEEIVSTLRSSPRQFTLSDLDQFDLGYSELDTLKRTMKQIPGQKSVHVPLGITHKQLQDRIAELEVTFPVLIQLVWLLVLRVYTNSSQAVTGYLASGRDAPIADIEGAIGPFISMLLCYIDFTDPQSLLALLKKLQQDSINGAAHQASSLAEIQNAVGITGGVLFNAGISFMPLLDKRAQQGSSLLFEEKSIKDPTEFELALIVETGEDATQISIHYRTSLVSEGHAKNIASTVNHVLTEILRDPSRTPDEIPALSSHDLQQLWKWNETCIAPVEECVHHFVERTMRDHPEKEAIFSWDGSLSYRELDDLSRNLAHHLKSLGIGPEKIVPLCFEKSKWAVVAMLAVLRAGACFVMLDPTHPDARVLSIAEEVETKVLLCSPLTEPKFEAIKEKALVIESNLAYGLPSTDPGLPVCPEVTPDNAMYVVFTSGTTGAPKGSITSHRAYCTGFREHAWAIEVGPESRTLQFSAYSFDASVGDILTTLLVGGCICIPSEEDRSMEISNFIAKSRATWAGWTPSFASLVDPDTVPTLTVLLMAGEPLPASQVDAWVDRLKLLNIYGPSECSVACVVNKDVTRETNASNIGRGYRCVTWVVDENDHERLRPIGSAGELLIEGPILARGYLKRPEKTAEVFIDAPSWLKNGPHPRTNRLYKTGDLVRYNSDGTINFIGRKDTQLKINGQRVEIGEIEHSLRSSIPPTAGPVVVDLLKRSGAGEQDLLAAFIHVGNDDTTPEDPDDIIATEPSALEKFQDLVKQIYETASSLPRYMSPHVFIPLKVLPITTAGKLDRRALQRVTSQLSRDELVSFTSSAKETGRTPEECQLAEMWKKVLRVSSVGIYDNFFRLGGDSVAAMALRSEARRSGLGISVADIFSNPVLADMANVMDRVAVTDGEVTIEPFALLGEYESVPRLVDEISQECGVSPEAVEDVLPCVPMQEALMALSARQSSAQTYVLHAPYKLPADIDEDRFQRAWEMTTKDHAVLRSRIVLKPQGALLVITKDSIPVTKHVGLLNDYMTQQRQQAFGYGTPLLRLGLVEEGDDRYFVFNAHHAIYDGWSTKLIWDTVLQHYRGEPRDPAPQFQALVAKLRATPKEPSEEYWREAIVERQGVSFPLIPVSHKPVARAGTSFRFPLPAASTSDRNVTPATLINAAWALVNAQYSADSTATYGCTLSGRDFPLPGIEQLVGPTIVTVPRQFAVRGDESLADFLDRVQRVAIESISHQHLGLSDIQAVSSAAQEAYDFASLMVVHPDAALRLPFEDINITPVPLDMTESYTYPLAVEFMPSEKELSIDVRFDPDCIDLDMVNIVMHHFDHILQGICNASASAVVGDVMTISREDASLIETWNSNSVNPVEACVHHLIEKQVQAQPDRPAVVSHDASLSYAELDLWANQIAHQITSTDLVKTGEFVGLCLDKSARAVPAMVAVLKAGGAFLPLNPDHPPARLQALLDEANVKLVLASPGRVASLSGSLNCKVLPVGNFQPAETVQPPSNVTVTPAQAAYLLFTSGSTGKPKGVVIDHLAWASAIAAQSTTFGFGPHIRMLQFSSYTFDAMIFEIFITLTSGGCVCAPSESERMNDLSGYITRERVNALISTPSVTRLLVPAKVPTLKLVMVGGEPLAPSDIEAWLSQPGVSFVNAYGPTEACVMATGRKVTPTDSSSNIGVPVGTATWVVSPFTQTLAPIGAVGELCIEGPTLARGYLGDPERTNASFETDPRYLPAGARRRIYHTGDLVRYNADGTITFVGRRDGQVKLRGQRVEVGEIEENIRKIMSKNPNFKHIGVELSDSPNNRNQPFLAALLVMNISYEDRVSDIGCASMMDLSRPELFQIATDLQQQLRTLLPEYMVPSAYIAVQQLPTTASSKRDRVFVKACITELSAKGLLFPVAAVKGERKELFGNEKLLQEWWAQVLKLDAENISAGDHFFALGGNSITAIRLAGLARSSKHRLMFEDIFSSPVLSEMASRIVVGIDQEKPMPKAFELLSASQLATILSSVLPLYGINKDEVEDIYPCTPLQEGLMAVTARNSGAYISADTMEISDAELPRLQEAWKMAFERFELLRTRIVLSHEFGSLQVVVRQDPIWHEATDIESFVHQVQELHGYGKPMVHLAVVPTQTSGIVKVVFSAHHSVYDGWSLGLIRQFLENHFTGDSTNSDSGRTVPFKLFMRHLIDQDPAEAELYWRQRMSGLEALPFPRPTHDPKHQPLATAFLEEAVPLPKSQSLGSAVTMATAVRAAWSLTISHYVASPDTVFGAIVTGRETTDISDIEAIAGPTIATVPTRIKIDYGSSISEFLADVQKDAVAESRFCQLGLQGIARVSKECHQSCEFGSILVVQPPSLNNGTSKVPTLRQGPVASPKFFPQALVLDCQLSSDNDHVSVTLSYDPEMVGDAHAAFVLSTFSTLLRNLISAPPSTLVQDLSGLSAAHVSEIDLTTRKKTPAIVDSCIHDLIEQQAKQCPNNVAIDAWDGSMTYAELIAVSSALAQQLQGLDIGPEKAVPFMFEKSKWAMVSMMAIWKAGGYFVPLDPKSPNQRLQHLVQATSANIIMTSSEYSNRCQDLGCKPVLVNEDTIPSLGESVTAVQSTVKTHNPAYVLFTSGTTGIPKGVLLEHRTLSSSISALGKYLGLNAETRFLQSCAYTFDVMLLDAFAALIHGGCVCVPSEHQKMNDLSGFVQDYQVNTTWFTTSLSRIIDPDSVPSLRTVVMGGEAVLQSDVDRWASKVRLVAGYGPTETCIVTLIGELTPTTPPNTVGWPVACRAWVVNPLKSSELVPIGGIGELCIEGPCLARGYLGNEVATKAAFIDAPSWLPGDSSDTRVYRTGDYVYYNADGTLSFFARKDSQVKIRGQRVELSEIEEAIRQNAPSWLTVAVDVFKPGGQDRQILAAVFGVGEKFEQAAGDSGPNAGLIDFMKELSKTLKGRLSETLPGHMLPDAYIPLPRIPVQTSGKLDRRVLQVMVTSMTFKSIATYTSADDSHQKPQTESERILARLWCTALKISDVSSVSASDNFFSLGGDSILAMRLVALLRTEGYSLAVAEIFSNPTLSGMASKMQQTESTGRPGGSKLLQTALSSRRVNDALKIKIAGKHDVELSRIEDIYPCTYMQEFFMEDSIKVPGAHVVQFIFALDGTINLLRLHSAIDRCALEFPILRTRLFEESKQLYQAVLSDKILWREVSETSLADALKTDKTISTGLGDALTRVTIVRGVEKVSTHLIWTLHHSLYDAWTLRLLLDAVNEAYQSDALQVKPRLAFQQLIEHIGSRDLAGDHSFWASYLSGAGNSPLFGYLFVRDPVKDMRADYQVSLPQKVEGATLTATIASAWVRAVSRLTQSNDVTIGYLVTGRAASIPGIQQCVGPAISKVPLRVRLEGGDTTADVSEKVQNELTRLMPYELSGLKTVQSASQDARDACRFPVDLTVHPHGTLSFAGEVIGMRFVGGEVATAPPGGFSVECTITENGIEVTAFWDSRAARKESIDSLLEDFKTVLLA